MLFIAVCSMASITDKADRITALACVLHLLPSGGERPNQIQPSVLVYFCGLLWPSLYWNKDSSLVYDTLKHFHYIITKSTTFYIQYNKYITVCKL